jgi:heme exporter protein A
MLTINKLEVAIDDITIVPPKCFELKAGQCLHIRGANGAGKTSFLKTLLGINDKVEGDVLLNGGPLALSEVGFVGHKLALFESLSVIENINYWAKIHKIKDSVENVLKATELWNFRETFGYELSEGQKKRLALARFFLLDKLVWCLDEPFSALDSHFCYQLAKAIEAFLHNGGFLIVTSHQSLPFANSDKIEAWF